MPDQSSRAVKTIAVMGVFAFVFLLLASFALRRSAKPDERQRVNITQKYSPFDRGRAWSDLKRIVELGPRPAGSEAGREELAYLENQVAQTGLVLWRSPIATGDADAEAELAVAEVRGTEPGALLVLTGYGTPDLDVAGFVGAHATASGSAWLIEMARALGPKRKGYTLLLAWVPAAVETTPTTEALIAKLTERGRMRNIKAVVEIGAIGDCYLGLPRDVDAPDWLSGLLWETGQRLGYRRQFEGGGLRVSAYLAPFRERELPAVALRDGHFGGALLAHQQTWHTAADTLERVCPASLQAVADVFYHALPAIEGHLDRLEQVR